MLSSNPGPRSLLTPLAALCALAACQPADAGRGSDDGASIPTAERYGGVAVIGGPADLQGMNALVSDEQYSRQVQRDLLFMPLLRYDQDLEPTAWLAQRWDTVRVAPDTLELTFHLRRDVRWHDGRPTTAEDVRFTYERAAGRESPTTFSGAFALYAPRAVVVDPHTVRVRLRPHSEFLDVWTQMPILPAHILGEVPADQLATHPFHSRQPVGNGPFRFVRRSPGQEWVFEANPDFPSELGGRPYLDRVVYRVIPDAGTLVVEALTGNVDVALGVAADQAERIESSPGVRILSTAAPQWVYIAWNTRLPMFDTPEERRALTMAIDRDRLVEGLLHRHALPGRSPVTPAHWSFDSTSPRTVLPFDPERARSLLARAGWSDRDRDGLLEDSQGRPFRFALLTPQGSETRKNISEVIQAQLRTIGVDVQPRVVEGNTMIAQIVGSLNDRGERVRDFDAVLTGWVDSFRKDDSNLLHSRHLNGPFQIVGYANPRADQLLDSLAVVLDRRQAERLWREYQALMVQESPNTVLYYPNRITAVSRRLRDVRIDARGELAGAARWWLGGEGGATPDD